MFGFDLGIISSCERVHHPWKANSHLVMNLEPPTKPPFSFFSTKSRHPSIPTEQTPTHADPSYLVWHFTGSKTSLTHSLTEGKSESHTLATVTVIKFKPSPISISKSRTSTLRWRAHRKDRHPKGGELGQH